MLVSRFRAKLNVLDSILSIVETESFASTFAVCFCMLNGGDILAFC